MSHDRDHDHPQPILPPKDPEPLGSQPKPDNKRPEHPSVVPREPVDPRTHPSRRSTVARTSRGARRADRVQRRGTRENHR